MEPILTTVTSKGQVTIPVEIRRLLGIEPNDKVAFVFDGHDVRIRRYGSVVEHTAGILARPDAPYFPTDEDLRAEAERVIAESAIERG